MSSGSAGGGAIGSAFADVGADADEDAGAGVGVNADADADVDADADADADAIAVAGEAGAEFLRDPWRSSSFSSSCSSSILDQMPGVR